MTDKPATAAPVHVMEDRRMVLLLWLTECGMVSHDGAFDHEHGPDFKLTQKGKQLHGLLGRFIERGDVDD